MRDFRKPFDAIVVGGGHNGLTAAAYLARGGLSTLVLERREVVGGCCVTEEIAAGCRASTTSYIASMLRPKVIRDLKLASHGLQMVPCDPILQVPFQDGTIMSWWADRDRMFAELHRLSVSDAEAFRRTDADLKRIALHIQPYFMKPPPNFSPDGRMAWWEILRVGRPLLGLSGRDILQMTSFLTGSLGDFLDRTYECEEVKVLMLANQVYGMHGGPYQPGTSHGLLFHLLGGGEEDTQGFSGHVIGGMGSITKALAAAAQEYGAEIRNSAGVQRILVHRGITRGVVLDDGTEIPARVVLSNADPKRTFLELVGKGELPAEFSRAIRGIKMDGPCAKVNMVLCEEPSVIGMPPDADPARRSLFTLIPSLEYAERSYNSAKLGQIPEELWIDCVVASNVDKTLAPPGKHIMTCFVQYVPYRLREGTWDEKRDLLGDRVVKRIAEYCPKLPRSILALQVLTPLDLERTYGLTEGNIFHGDLKLEQLFYMRPLPGWSRYRTPIHGLYLCGAGAHPGGGVTGAPGHNAAHQVLRDLRSGNFSFSRKVST